MKYLFTALGVLFLLAAIYMATAYFCFRKAARRGREANIDKFLAAKQFDDDLVPVYIRRSQAEDNLAKKQTAENGANNG